MESKESVESIAANEDANKTEPTEEVEVNKKRKIDDVGATPSQNTKKSTLGAQFWYYLDSEEKKQGPFYPGVMRAWFEEGYFVEKETKAAPSFVGEIPRQSGFMTLADLFDEPLKATAFKSADGVALFPPKVIPPVIVNDDDEEDEKRPMYRKATWLDESLERKRKGEYGSIGGGPILKGSFIN